MIINYKIYLIILFGLIFFFVPIFFGYNFFVEEDVFTLYDHTNGNISGNGWRSDKGLGTSFFFGDPGAYHAWSILTLINKLFPYNNYYFFNFSIIFFLFLGVFATSKFLYSINNKNSFLLTILLSFLVLANPMRHELLFQRHWIASTFSLPILLFFTKVYFDQKKPVCYFYISLAMCLSLYLGSIATLQNILMASFIHLILHCFYKKEIFSNVASYFKLILSSLILTLLIGSWVWYPIFLEYFTIGYDRSYVEFFDLKNFHFSFTFHNLIKFFFGLFNSGIFSSLSNLPDKGLLPLHSWFNVIPIFPLIFVFYLFNKTKNYWEFVAKYAVLFYLLHYFLIIFFGGYKNLPIYFFKLYSWHKIFLENYFFQIILINFFFLRINEFKFSKNFYFNISKNITFLTVLIIHSLLLIFCILSLFNFSEYLVLFINKVFNEFSYFFMVEDLALNKFNLIVTEIIIRLSNSVDLTLVLFYVTTILLVYFINSKKNKFSKNLVGIYFILIFLNCLFMSLSIYPFSKNNLIWDHNKYEKIIKKLDRTAYIDLSIDEIHENKNLNEKLNIWKINSNKTRQVGYLSPPGIAFSSILSHWNKDTSEFLRYHFKDYEIKNLRQISNGKNSILKNQQLLNFLGIKYLYFKNKPNKNYLNNNYELISENNGLYIYENKNSFPHFYLGKYILKKNNFNINNIQKGDVVLSEMEYQNYSNLNFLEESVSLIDLVDNKNGYYKFNYNSKKENLLIILDSWHPNWKVKIIKNNSEDNLNEKKISVLKANHIFKGVFLPKGNYVFELYYDLKNYYFGVYITLITIILLTLIFFKYYNNEKN